MARALQFKEEQNISTILCTENVSSSSSMIQPTIPVTSSSSSSTVLPSDNLTATSAKPHSILRKRRASQDLAEIAEHMDGNVPSFSVTPSVPTTPSRRTTTSSFRMTSIYDVTPERSRGNDPATDMAITASPFGNTSAVSSVASSILTPNKALARASSILQSNLLLHSAEDNPAKDTLTVSPYRSRNPKDNHVKFQDTDNTTITVKSSPFGLPTTKDSMIDSNTDSPPNDETVPNNLHGNRTPVRIPGKGKPVVHNYPSGDMVQANFQSPMMATTIPSNSLVPVTTVFSNGTMLSPATTMYPYHYPNSYSASHGSTRSTTNPPQSSSSSYGTSVHTAVAYSPILMNNYPTGVSSTQSGAYYYAISPMNTYITYPSTPAGNNGPHPSPLYGYPYPPIHSSPYVGQSMNGYPPQVTNLNSSTDDDLHTDDNENDNGANLTSGNDPLFTSPFTSIHTDKRISNEAVTSVATTDERTADQNAEEFENAVLPPVGDHNDDDDNTTIELTEEEFSPSQYPIEQGTFELPHNMPTPTTHEPAVSRLVPLPVAFPPMLPYLPPGGVPLHMLPSLPYNYPDSSVQPGQRIIPTRSMFRTQTYTNAPVYNETTRRSTVKSGPMEEDHGAGPSANKTVAKSIVEDPKKNITLTSTTIAPSEASSNPVRNNGNGASMDEEKMTKHETEPAAKTHSRIQSVSKSAWKEAVPFAAKQPSPLPTVDPLKPSTVPSGSSTINISTDTSGKIQVITTTTAPLVRPSSILYPVKFPPMMHIPTNNGGMVISYDGTIVPVPTTDTSSVASKDRTFPAFHFPVPVPQLHPVLHQPSTRFIFPSHPSIMYSSTVHQSYNSSNPLLSNKTPITKTHTGSATNTPITTTTIVVPSKSKPKPSPPSINDTTDTGTDTGKTIAVPVRPQTMDPTTASNTSGKNSAKAVSTVSNVTTSSTSTTANPVTIRFANEPQTIPSSSTTTTGTKVIPTVNMGTFQLPSDAAIRRGPGRPRKDGLPTSGSTVTTTTMGAPSTKKMKISYNSSDTTDNEESPKTGTSTRTTNFTTTIFDRNKEAAEKITTGAVSPTTLAKHTNRLLWQPGCSRYLGVTRGAGKNEFKWFTTLTYRDDAGMPQREGSHYLSRSRAEQFFVEKAKKYNVDLKDRIRVLWPGEAKARELEAKLGIDWDTGFTRAELQHVGRQNT